ncbi:hypothetical protein ACIQ9P_05715 [Kitasatospora sp. NPDC094019]|uniref:hypothetical protein n=1 Tax=Kitasatospora sp. NPDC094019 TaxID=3364091 RepID=UPI0037F9C67C
MATAGRQYGDAKKPFAERTATARVPVDWSPLDDYRSTPRTAPGVAEVVQRDAIRAHCSCPQCAARRAA